jgi:hypothetical protein
MGKDRGDVVALGLAHRAASFGLVDRDAAPPEDLDEDARGGPAAVIDGRPGPVEDDRPDPKAHDHSSQVRSARPNAIVMPAPPMPEWIETPGIGSAT